ncbi:MAG TPA: hypothetical protein VM470_02785, partial [Acidimicrobiia bacterium]|nr:hypothetical protein [Acidimicrobiia bacterium]
MTTSVASGDTSPTTPSGPPGHLPQRSLRSLGEEMLTPFLVEEIGTLSSQEATGLTWGDSPKRGGAPLQPRT